MFNVEIKSKFSEDISILIKQDNNSFNYLCECGEASGLSVRDIQQIEAIFISHTHIDHFANFDSIIRHQIGIKRRVVICGPKQIAEQIMHKLKAFTWNLIQSDSILYEVKEFTEDHQISTYELSPPHWNLKKIREENSSVIYKNDRFRVKAKILDHKTPSMAYQFKEFKKININLNKTDYKPGAWINTLKDAYLNNNPEAIITINQNLVTAGNLFHLFDVKDGDSVGIIMDHAPSEENHFKIKELFSQTNTIYIESFYKTEDKEFALKNYHSYAEASAEIMSDVKPKHAIPVHFSRKYSQLEIDTIINEFKQKLT